MFLNKVQWNNCHDQHSARIGRCWVNRSNVCAERKKPNDFWIRAFFKMMSELFSVGGNITDSPYMAADQRRVIRVERNRYGCEEEEVRRRSRQSESRGVNPGMWTRAIEQFLGLVLGVLGLRHSLSLSVSELWIESSRPLAWALNNWKLRL